MDDYEGLKPELVELLMSGALTEEELAAVDKKLAQAQALRNNALEGAQGRQAGRTFVAANPMEHIGKLMQFYGGMKQETEAEKTRTGIMDEERKRQRQYADAVLYPNGRPMKLDSVGGWAWQPEMPKFDPNSIPAPKKF